eukprot:gnl/MRDRNA2_/MRDRNA2_33579_c0_seq1.p1 gnl/MRDRNA2_/MRDRNA2_33579_c0~~gnl/MRDRNA2_/MRDRNA2_33579_c0_seq1.p1  ORF type:complete len:386 (+),score=82.60 gnl/MRDRNA2_/MRDRNA2_33579_c0_seq1:61-1158(+)
MMATLTTKPLALRRVAKAETSLDDDQEEDASDLETESETCQVSLPRDLRSGHSIERGTARRRACEDRAVAKVELQAWPSECCVFYAIFDGHGGEDCSEYASTHMAKNLQSKLHERRRLKSHCAAVKSAIQAAFKMTDQNFIKYALAEHDYSGSTGCSVIVYGPDEKMRLRLIVANVGDSRAVLGKSNGQAIRLSNDHKPDTPSEAERVILAGGSVEFHDGCWRVVLPQERQKTFLDLGLKSLAVSRALGDQEFKPDLVSAEPEISVHEVDYNADEVLIIASDGVWDVFSDDEAVRLVLKCLREDKDELPENERDLQEERAVRASRILIEAAKDRGSGDDRSAIVVHFGWRVPELYAGDEQKQENQ